MRSNRPSPSRSPVGHSVPQPLSWLRVESWRTARLLGHWRIPRGKTAMVVVKDANRPPFTGQEQLRVTITIQVAEYRSADESYCSSCFVVPWSRRTCRPDCWYGCEVAGSGSDRQSPGTHQTGSGSVAIKCRQQHWACAGQVRQRQVWCLSWQPN